MDRAVNNLVEQAAELLTAMAEARMEDFAPYIRGEASLEELRAKGVDTRVIKSLSVRRGSDGTIERKVVLHDPRKAKLLLHRLAT